VFLCETEEFINVEDMIHPVPNSIEQNPKYLFSVILGSTDLN